MKKSIIAAGAASIALAAMPVVSTFALTKTIEDDITVNLNSTCSLTRTGAAGTGSNAGAWTPATEDPTTSAGTYSVTMDAGATSNLGTSTFTITCNDTSTAGHNLTVTVSGLGAGNTESQAAQNAPISYDGTKTVGTDAGSYWNITKAAGTGTLPGFTAGIVTLPTSGDDLTTQTIYSSTNPGVVINAATFTAEYNVSTTVLQPAGTYTGSAVYTLTHGA